MVPAKGAQLVIELRF